MNMIMNMNLQREIMVCSDSVARSSFASVAAVNLKIPMRSEFIIAYKYEYSIYELLIVQYFVFAYGNLRKCVCAAREVRGEFSVLPSRTRPLYAAAVSASLGTP